MSTPMTPREKDWIDKASYEALLRRWRFTITPPGESIFSGESATYYAEVMRKRREEIGPAGHTATSKAIGWEP